MSRIDWRDVVLSLLVIVATAVTNIEAQPTAGAPVNDGLTWTSGAYTYDAAGNIVAVGTPSTPGTQGYRTYGYDQVSRLTRATIGVTPAAMHEYRYDEYGNRTGYAVNGQWVNVPAAAATNRLTNAAYDAAGNQTSRGSTAATYDGFGMPTSYRFDAVNAETFVYNANDERIGVLRGTEWTWSLRDPAGQVIRQYRSSSTSPFAAWVWVEDFVYRDGHLLGSERVPEEGGRRHYHLDHLGSPRLVTGTSGSVVSEHDFLPFGEERTLIGQQLAKGFDREEPHRFTGHERDFDTATPNDSSSYVDAMHARYYVARAGRFMSPDPILGNLLRPQSWNRYAYVLNSPIQFADPSGMAEVRQIQGGAGSFTCIDAHCTAEIIVSARDPLHDLLHWQMMRWLSDPVNTAHPISNMTLAEHLRATELGITEFVDGVVPGLDVDESDYGANVDGLAYSEILGEYTRDAEIMIASVGAGWAGAGARTAGREFSHWIPDRLLKRTGSRWIRRTFGRSRFNGNYVTRARHYKHDPHRYPAGWRNLGPRYNPVVRQLDRVPRVYYGIGAAFALRGVD